MSRYVVGHKDESLRVVPAKDFATRDAAIDWARARPSALHQYVIDTTEQTEIGWATEGRFVWALNG